MTPSPVNSAEDDRAKLRWIENEIRNRAPGVRMALSRARTTSGYERDYITGFFRAFDSLLDEHKQRKLGDR